MENDIGFDHGLESQPFGFDAIRSGRQVRDVVTSRLVCKAFVADACTRIDDDNFGIRDDCFAGVRDSAGQRCIGRLGANLELRTQAKKDGEEGYSAQRCHQKCRTATGKTNPGEIVPSVVESGSSREDCTLRDADLLSQRRIQFAMQRGQFAVGFQLVEFPLRFQHPCGGPAQRLIPAVPAFHVARHSLDGREARLDRG